MGAGCSCMAGTVKIGGSKNPGKLVTPALVNLASTATVELSFDGEPYYIREPRTVQVLVLISSANGTDNLVNPAANHTRVAATFDLEGGYDMRHYAVDLINVQPGDRGQLRQRFVGGFAVELEHMRQNHSVCTNPYIILNCYRISAHSLFIYPFVGVAEVMVKR